MVAKFWRSCEGSLRAKFQILHTLQCSMKQISQDFLHLNPCLQQCWGGRKGSWFSEIHESPIIELANSAPSQIKEIAKIKRRTERADDVDLQVLANYRRIRGKRGTCYLQRIIWSWANLVRGLLSTNTGKQSSQQEKLQHLALCTTVLLQFMTQINLFTTRTHYYQQRSRPALRLSKRPALTRSLYRFSTASNGLVHWCIHLHLVVRTILGRNRDLNCSSS